MVSLSLQLLLCPSALTDVLCCRPLVTTACGSHADAAPPFAGTAPPLCWDCAGAVGMEKHGCCVPCWCWCCCWCAGIQMEEDQNLQRLLSQRVCPEEEEEENPLERSKLLWSAVSGMPGGAKGRGEGKRGGSKALAGGEEKEGGNLALPRPVGPLPWSPEEDAELLAFVETYGARHWRRVPKMTRLRRDPQTCRLRWLNHLCFQVQPSPPFPPYSPCFQVCPPPLPSPPLPIPPASRCRPHPPSPPYSPCSQVPPSTPSPSLSPLLPGAPLCLEA